MSAEVIPLLATSPSRTLEYLRQLHERGQLLEVIAFARVRGGEGEEAHFLASDGICLRDILLAEFRLQQYAREIDEHGTHPSLPLDIG